MFIFSLRLAPSLSRVMVIAALAACGEAQTELGEPSLGVSRAPSSRPSSSRVPSSAAPAAPALGFVYPVGCGDHADEEAGIEARERASRPVHWRGHRPQDTDAVVPVRLLAINDFHGRLAEGLLVAGRPVGGAAVLAAYLNSAATDFPGRSLLVHAGDLVGASPPSSALLQDEPTIQFMNLLANRHCRGATRPASRCNIVGTLGNHEFDEGADQLLRLVYGGEHPAGPFLESPYGGARFPYVSANVVRSSGGTLLPPFVIVNLGGVRVGVIGAVLKETPAIVTPSGVAGLEFLDEATAINAQVAELERRGVQAIIVTIHQGAPQTSANDAPTDPSVSVGAPIATIVDALDDAVDVVVSGHSHAFTNALLPNRNGSEILVTQAFSNGTAFGQLDLELDRRSGDVVSKSARIITTFSDQAPGNVRDREVQALVDAATASVAPLVNDVVALVAADITRAQTAAGESALGDLIADAQRAALGTDFGFMNPGGVRADVFFAADPANPADVAGSVTWGELFTVQPFGNSLVSMELTGAQIVQLLEQQWLGQVTPRQLQVSGLTYRWDAAAPDGEKIVEVLQDGAPLDPLETYTATANSFIAAGGDGFTVFTSGLNQEGGPIDLDALISFVAAQPQPLEPPPRERITRLN
jgi:5'-nucleotidase